ncbi:hypothetical protein V8G54_036024 [Vigna mungo]|uniref:Anaphase-promoting complex subunit 5 n=1 Tax=Vigna mungo TaxID=3915 RepID=A0AAQ3MG63_VIGMU
MVSLLGGDQLFLGTNPLSGLVPLSTVKIVIDFVALDGGYLARRRQSMGGVLKQPGAFAITPHKVSLCILLKIYAPPAQISIPFPFSSVAQHNRLGMFLLALTKSCDDILEPKLDELVHQLRMMSQNWEASWVIDQLMSRLSSLSSPDDLFNFFSDIRGAVEDDQVILDMNSNLGIFLRRCVLAFNLLSFEGLSHLLTNLGIYCKEELSNCPSYEEHSVDDCSSNLESYSEYENMDLENFVYEKVSEEIEARKEASGVVPFHLHAPKTLLSLVDDIDVPADSVSKQTEKVRVVNPYGDSSSNILRDVDHSGAVFLRTNWQVQGYLQEQADTIEKNGNAVSYNGLEIILQQLQKLAPELHRGLKDLILFLRLLAMALEDMKSFHFGHPKMALEVLTEAVRVSQQQSNDTCLAYTLAAISNLLFENGISSTAGTLGSSYSPFTSIGVSLSVQQQLFVLLRGSLKRAESLKLKRLVASNHLAMAKFDLTHVQRPLLSFGPKTNMKLSTCPVNVCKEIRLSSQLISDFSYESSAMTIDGAFSTAWLRNLQKPTGSIVLCQEIGSGSSTSVSQFIAQPTSIPGSVLQVLGSSYILRATAWELYGRGLEMMVVVSLRFGMIYEESFVDPITYCFCGLVAFSALKIAEEKFLSVSKSQILLLKLQLLHEHALHRGKLKLAQKLCDELGVLASRVTGVDMELKTEASLRHARTLLAAKQFREAAVVAHSLFCMCYKYNLQVENASVLLLLAEIHKKSGNAVLGLPYALASLSFCLSFNLDLLKASATLTLAELWLSLGSSHATRALNLIHGAFPMILGHGGLELRSRAYIVEAKCYLCDSNFNVFEDYEVVIDSLRQASEELQLLEFHELAAEAFYLKAMVYDKLGKLEEREEAAAIFRKHILAIGNPQDEDDPLVRFDSS